MNDDEREQIAVLVEEFGRTNIPPRIGMDLSQSPLTVDQWLEDAWQMAIEGAARVIRESGPRLRVVGDGVVIRYGENWRDLFEPVGGKSPKWRCKACGAKGYIDPDETPSVRWWTTDHLNGHEVCHCGKVVTARGMNYHRWSHRKGDDDV